MSFSVGMWAVSKIQIRFGTPCIIKCNLYKLFYHNQPLDERISFLSFLDFHWNKNIVEMDNFASTKVNMQKKFEEKLNILMQ